MSQVQQYLQKPFSNKFPLLSLSSVFLKCKVFEHGITKKSITPCSTASCFTFLPAPVKRKVMACFLWTDSGNFLFSSTLECFFYGFQISLLFCSRNVHLHTLQLLLEIWLCTFYVSREGSDVTLWQLPKDKPSHQYRIIYINTQKCVRHNRSIKNIQNSAIHWFLWNCGITRTLYGLC